MRTITLNILFGLYAFFSALVIYYQSIVIDKLKINFQIEKSESSKQIEIATLKLQDIYDKLQILAGIKP